jgi:hypothetical protein
MNTANPLIPGAELLLAAASASIGVLVANRATEAQQTPVPHLDEKSLQARCDAGGRAGRCRNYRRGALMDEIVSDTAGLSVDHFGYGPTFLAARPRLHSRSASCSCRKRPRRPT